MKIEIQGNGIEIDKSVRRFVEHRVDFALSSRADHIESVLVHLADLGSAEDAGDRSCYVQVRLHGLDDVVVEKLDANLYVAIHLAVDRAGWTTARSILRQHRKLIETLVADSMAASGRPAYQAA